MKKTLCAILTAGALTCALSLPVASQDKDQMKPGGALTSAQSLPPSAQDNDQMKPVQHERMEEHPEIREAIHHLEQAKQSLEHAAHDFGGHRSKALEHVNQALAECNEALHFGRR